MKRMLLMTLALIVALPILAHAAEGTTPLKAEMKDAMKAAAKAKIDTDGNGLVSKAEFMASQEKRFAEMDSDKDGNISDDEHKNAMDKMRSKRDELRSKIKEKMTARKDAAAVEEKAATPAE